MTPSQLSIFLNHIASKIESSKNPNKELVIRDLKNIILAMKKVATEITINFEMPGDQDWPKEFWERIGEDPEFDKLNSAFETLGVEVDDSEGITLTFDKNKEIKVRELIENARFGKYGKDVKTYWDAGKEVKDEWTTEDEAGFNESGGFDPFED